jgi:hypothetical protein
MRALLLVTPLQQARCQVPRDEALQCLGGTASVEQHAHADMAHTTSDGAASVRQRGVLRELHGAARGPVGLRHGVRQISLLLCNFYLFEGLEARMQLTTNTAYRRSCVRALPGHARPCCRGHIKGRASNLLHVQRRLNSRPPHNLL